MPTFIADLSYRLLHSTNPLPPLQIYDTVFPCI